MLLPGERLLTDLASVRRVTGVLLHMIREMFFPSERLLAKLTAVRRFARVNSGTKKINIETFFEMKKIFFYSNFV